MRAATETKVALFKYFTIQIQSEHIRSQMIQSRKEEGAIEEFGKWVWSPKK